MVDISHTPYAAAMRHRACRLMPARCSDRTQDSMYGARCTIRQYNSGSRDDRQRIAASMMGYQSVAWGGRSYKSVENATLLR